jgi:hypothetical protein
VKYFFFAFFFERRDFFSSYGGEGVHLSTVQGAALNVNLASYDTLAMPSEGEYAWISEHSLPAAEWRTVSQPCVGRRL